jgi:hypothetical protein
MWNGWQLSNEGDKIGFTPLSTASSSANSTKMVLDFNFPQRIRSITFFFMKSYGDKWQDSQLEAKIWRPSQSNDRRLLDERHLLGTHNKQTSEMYTEEIILKEPVDAGETVQLEATLVGGTTFKIMGLAVCS